MAFMKTFGHTEPAYEATLKHAFGYDSFRPMQREIIVAAMEGKDVFALLPTGGGKSLCFQLPALLREGLTIVVSPLIALMKDQVDQLDAAGVSATYLNSSLRETEARARLRGLHEGRFRLLYVAPERLMLENWKENLRSWNVTSIAIDEAHCISEWGHDFRPEYRQISKLRDLLPDVPVIALTATATGRVRADIIEHLRLRDPSVFVSSFFRPNLRYRVEQKSGPLVQISSFVSERPGQSGIIYCASRAATERVAEALEARGFPARPYHAGLTSSQRSENQELFIRDEVPIICATIAFGMGINKPNVRWIIHHDIPKNMEGYYQETGRAGRDGLPSDCLLLFSAGDAAKQTHFIDEITDEDERQAARDQLRRMVTYAECPSCRWWNLLSYFDETPSGDGCGNCDNCTEPRETYDGTLHGQKLLSCVYRISQVTRFSTGLNHVIDVLTGSQNEKIRKWGHDQISTHGIGKDLGRAEWASLGRELIRLGLLGQAAGKFPTVEIMPEGIEALRSRRIIRLTRPLAAPAQKKRREAPGTIACDEVLFERLRALRKKLADERGVPAYVILGDVTLRQMARDLPTTLAAMAVIPGWGEKKLAQFAKEFAEEIAGYRVKGVMKGG